MASREDRSAIPTPSQDTSPPANNPNEKPRFSSQESQVKVAVVPGGTAAASSHSIPRQSRTRMRRIVSPWQHGMSKEGSSSTSDTVRHFDPQRQRRRLFANSLLPWFITVTLCSALAACLIGFESMPFLTTKEKHAFNALIIMLSLLLGANLASSLRDYAQMLRWRLMTVSYRTLSEFDLLMQCESQRKVLKLFWKARTPSRLRPNETQLLCAIWISTHLLLQVLVALLGLTYSLEPSQVMQVNHGKVSVCDLSTIRDIWGRPKPSYYAQLGSANYYGIQGQDYNFVKIGRAVSSFGSPTLYYTDNSTAISYSFKDRNVEDPTLAITSTRTVNTRATCKSFDVVEGGYGHSPNVTYSDGSQHITIDVVRVGPGAMTYLGNLEQGCGARCTQVMALQSGGSSAVPDPSFFKCNNTISTVRGVPQYVQPGQNSSVYEIADEQARILSGAIGWSGFNHTPGDPLQYVRYSLDTWWSPEHPTSELEVAERIMEFSIEGIAAMDTNGPRKVISGFYPVASQKVTVRWQWAATILGLVPLVQFAVLYFVVKWANGAIIKDESFLGIARLLRPLVERLGGGGCLLTGDEISEKLGAFKIAYGYRTQNGALEEDEIVRHVDILEEQEGFGKQTKMPAGKYNGL